MSGGGIPIGVGGGGIGVLVLLLIALLTGNVPGTGDGGGGGGLDLPQVQSPTGSTTVEEGSLADAVNRVHSDVENMWTNLFERAGREYHASTLVLFSQGTQGGCGFASSQVGPHYCPTDEKVYIDLAFFQELKERFGAAGDFAQFYVVAHEVGHHVQNVLGINDRVENREDSIRLELQADCLAGVWAHSVYARGDLEPGDVEEGLAAAQAVGDDRIQEQAGMTVDPETWTHGSAEQRQRWFERGFESGESSQCNTFS